MRLTPAPSRVRAVTEAELKAYNLPPGTSAQIDEATGKVDVICRRDNTGVLNQKDATTAKMKLNTVRLARQQLNRIRDGLVGNHGDDTDSDVLMQKLGQELADVVIYCDLMAQAAGLDLSTCVQAKFNEVSERNGFPERV